MIFGEVNVTNQPDNPASINPLGMAPFTASRSGILVASAGQETLYQVTSPVVIETLEVTGEKPNAPQLRIFAWSVTGTWEPVTLQLLADGSGLTGIVPGQINTHGSSVFENIVYDQSENRYKYGLMRPLAFPRGVRLTLDNASTTDQNVGAYVYGRVMK